MALIDDAAGMDSIIGYGVGAGGILLAIAQMAWSRFFGEGRSNAVLLEQLTERISTQEQRIINLEQAHADELSKRLNAETRVRWLELSVRLLKAELARHGIEIPPGIEPEAPPEAQV